MAQRNFSLDSRITVSYEADISTIVRSNRGSQLNNGASMPLIHLGVYMVDGDSADSAVKAALEVRIPCVSNSHDIDFD